MMANPETWKDLHGTVWTVVATWSTPYVIATEDLAVLECGGTYCLRIKWRTSNTLDIPSCGLYALIGLHSPEASAFARALDHATFRERTKALRAAQKAAGDGK